MMQRLITQQVVDQKGARYITDALWMLMENNIEEVKVLQTVTLLLTTNTVVHGETLAKSLVLCFRLHYTKNSTIVNTAGATIRQLVSLVFERVYLEKNSMASLQGINQNANKEALDTDNSTGASAEMQTFAADAFFLFQVSVFTYILTSVLYNRNIFLGSRAASKCRSTVLAYRYDRNDTHFRFRITRGSIN